MTIAASVIISRVQTTLLDLTGVLWTQAELLDYLNAGINAIVAVKPDVSVATATFAVTNASAKQTIPSDGLELLDVVRNLSTTGTAIRQVERNHLNHISPTWAKTSTTGDILHYTHDKRNPTIFYIYPQPASGTNNIELVYAQIPARLTLVSQSIPIADIYESPLHNYVVAYAYAKNAKRGDLTKAQAYFAMFANSIGARTQAQFMFSPDTPNEKGGESNNQLGGPQE